MYKINDENINIRFYKHGTPEFDAIRNYIEQGNRIQMQDKDSQVKEDL